jgi:hypothetical protein
MRGLLCAVLLLLTIPADAWDARLQWQDNATTEAKFEIERRAGLPTSTAAWAKIGETPTDTALYQDANLPASQWFCWRVRAVNQAGASGYTNTACFGPPADPTNLVPVILGVIP